MFKSARLNKKMSETIKRWLSSHSLFQTWLSHTEPSNWKTTGSLRRKKQKIPSSQFSYLNSPGFDLIRPSSEEILESKRFVALHNDFFQNAEKEQDKIVNGNRKTKNSSSQKKGFMTLQQQQEWSKAKTKSSKVVTKVTALVVLPFVFWLFDNFSVPTKRAPEAEGAINSALCKLKSLMLWKRCV